MTNDTKERFRGLRSYYEPQTDTHLVHVYDKATGNIKVSLRITDTKIQVVKGEVIQ